MNSVVSDDDTPVSGEIVICPKCMQSDYVHPVRTGEKTGVAAGAFAGGIAGFCAERAAGTAGMLIGAQIGSVVPGIGTAIGAVTGGLIGIASGVLTGVAIGKTAGKYIDKKYIAKYKFRLGHLSCTILPSLVGVLFWGLGSFRMTEIGVILVFLLLMGILKKRVMVSCVPEWEFVSQTGLY